MDHKHCPVQRRLALYDSVDLCIEISCLHFTITQIGFICTKELESYIYLVLRLTGNMESKCITICPITDLFFSKCLLHLLDYFIWIHLVQNMKI